MEPSTTAKPGPQPGKLTVVSTRGLIHLNAGWFGLAYLWNGLHSILLPAMLLALAPPGLKNTYLGGLTFVGLMLAMVTQPVAGAISDRSGWMGQWGKRRPWMVLGTGGDVLLLALLALGIANIQSIWVIAIAYVGLQLASSFVEAALQSLLPDLVPAEQRGRGAGYKNAAQIAGFVAGVGLGGVLAAQGHMGAALAATAAVLAITVGWTSLTVHEQPVQRLKHRAIGAGEALRTLFVGSFHFDHQVVPGYARLLAGRALLMAGYFALQAFAQYFIADTLPVRNATGTTALLMAVMGAAIFLLAVPAGVLGDRIGRRPVSLFAGGLGVLATLCLLFVGNIEQLVLAGGLVGASAGIFLSVNWAWGADLVPPDEAGRYLGLGNLATAGAGAFSRLFAGPIVDTGNALHLGLGYHVLFVVLAAGMVAGTALLAGVPETRSQTAEPVAEAVRSDREA